MIDLNDTDIFPWYQDTIQDLVAGDYPNLCEMSSEELTKLSQKLFWDAQGLFDTVCRIEGEAEAIAALARVKGAIEE